MFLAKSKLVLLLIVSFFISHFTNNKALAQSSGLKTPNMSANALFLYQNSNFHKEDTNSSNLDPDPNGFKVQELELQFYSDIDPYSQLNLLLSIHSELESNGTDVSEKWLIEPEEAFMNSNFFSNITFKLGKFKAAMGKYNTLHAHAYPFIKSPMSHSTLLGDEGLNDAGVSMATLLPSSWFSEFTIQYLRGSSNNSEFNSPTPSNGVILGHFKNLVDLTDSLTMEMGISYARGGNSLKSTTDLTGADLTFKWRPNEGGKYQSFLWTTEYLTRLQTQSPAVVSADEKGSGIASWIQYQFAERWAVLYRYEQVKIAHSLTPTTLPNKFASGQAIALALNPSEFSTFKIEYDLRHPLLPNANGDNTEQAIFAQANFTIGSHPTHSY